MKEENISKLKKEGVRFLPWVGEYYDLGITYDNEGNLELGKQEEPGKKILVLGESHYCAKAADAKDDLTQKIIKDYIDENSVFEPYKNTYTKFSKALVGQDEFDREKLWNHIAFYNFVQEPMDGPRRMPSNKQYADSMGVFLKVLHQLQPDFLIVWGERLYNQLPKEEDSHQGEDNEVECDGEVYCYETRIYSLRNEKTVRVLYIYHPASGFDWGYWHKVICKGMEG